MNKCLCKVCGITDFNLFYSGIATYCKEHWKEKVKANRAENSAHYKEFDRARASLPHRIEARELYKKTIAYSEAHKKACKKYADKNPVRRAAHIAVGHALRSGKLYPLPCFCCGDKAKAHHPDYSSPLDVIWLCPAHHKQTHAMAKRIEKEAA